MDAPQEPPPIRGRTAVRNAIRAGAEAAARRLGPFIARTPMIRSGALSAVTGGEIYLKLECHQLTGSLEARAALAALTHSFKPGTKPEMVVASTGNFGFALAWAARRFGGKVTVVMPSGAAVHKREALERASATVVDGGADFAATSDAARILAEETGQVLIEREGGASFAGLATIGAEIEEQVAELGVSEPAALICPIGTGTLASAVGGYLRAKRRGIVVVGARAATPSYGPDDLMPLADAVAGIEATRALAPPDGEVDELHELTEDEIAIAMASMHASHALDLEGAGALAAAALLRDGARWRGRTVIALLSGANVDPEQHALVSGPYAPIQSPA